MTLALATTTSGPALWYLTRGSGLVALLLLTASVVLGIVTAGRVASTRWPRFVTAGLHRNVSLLVVVFLAIHIASTVVDGYVPIGWLDTVVPFRSPYRPLSIGLGAIAFDLMLALIVTSLVRRRLGYRTWHAIHWLAYACWPVAMLHGFDGGTDTRLTWALGLYAACLASVVLALAWRIARVAVPDPDADAPGARPSADDWAL